MGGPCYIIDNNDDITHQRIAPNCTDNFQIILFDYDGLRWYSVEQCYQAAKYISDYKIRINNKKPYETETDMDYGLRVWSYGQKNTDEMNPEWIEKRVHIMYCINRAKYACNPDLQEELLTTENKIIWGRPSTHQWQIWNGIIQMIIRDEIKSGINLNEKSALTYDEFNEKTIPYINIYQEIGLVK